MTSTTHRDDSGIIFQWPRAYDWLLRLVWGRHEGAYRERVLSLAGLGPGLSVLDVGCGTGTQAIAARYIVGTQGRVSGVDASAKMIARAHRKAEGIGADIDFQVAAAQNLPFEDSQFDIVLSTTLIHCVPDWARTQCFTEMARVLKPGGRLLLVDFGGSAGSKHSLFGHMSAHRKFDLNKERSRLAGAGLVEIDKGPIGFSDLCFMLCAR